MTVEVDKNNKNVVIVGIRIDSHSREVLSWALVKVAEPGDCIIAIHVCRSSDHVLSDKPLVDSYLEVYNGLCSEKKVVLTGMLLKGKSVREVLVREAKNCDAVALVVGTSKQCTLGKWGSTAKYCAKKLPPTTNVLAINNGKIVFKRSNSHQLPGLLGDPIPSITSKGSPEFGGFESETETVKSTSDQMTRSSQDGSSSSLGSEDFRSYMVNFVHKQEKSISRSTSVVSDQDATEQSPGWPLLCRATSAILQTQNARDISVVQWVMSLPDRSPRKSPESLSPRVNTLDREISDIAENVKNNLSALAEVPEGFEDLLETSLHDCQWFSLEVLKASTCHFSSENLIGKGGINSVFKGTLPDGKTVAVKTTKSTKETWKDFAYEVKIISSLKHKNIIPLLGICVEDSDKLISIYEFFPKGSLEENLYGKSKDKIVMPWEVRFNIAIGIAEALNYLHKECPQPVIHRDVKSSNIILSDGFEPKLSDFGLALLGPTTSSSFMTEGDVVGTFGYLAPEYFMYGKVSDKIDVYAFGVVLLELLSGRRPIGFDTPNGQESLVIWAKPKLESGDIKCILDQNLDGKFDEIQMQRMILAANLCITRSSRLRPNINEILKLLKGDIDVEKWVKSQSVYIENQDGNDDEVYPSSSAELHISVAMIDVEDDTTSFSSVDQSNIKEYLNGRWSRSSSFD